MKMGTDNLSLSADITLFYENNMKQYFEAQLKWVKPFTDYQAKNRIAVKRAHGILQINGIPIEVYYNSKIGTKQVLYIVVDDTGIMKFMDIFEDEIEEQLHEHQLQLIEIGYKDFPKFLRIS